MTSAKPNPQQPNSSKNNPSPSAYTAAQRAQAHRRLRRWLPLDESADISEIFQLYTNLAARLRSARQWAEVVAQLKAWLLAQPERWLRLLAALRPGQALRRMSLSQLVALALSTGLTAGIVSQPLAALAQGPVPIGNEFQINTYTIGPQIFPSVAMDSDGDFVVVWEGGYTGYWDQDGDGPGIFAQRYDKNSNPVGSEFQVNTYTTGPQEKPVVAMDTTGNFVIVWQDGNRFISQDGDAAGIFAQRYDKDGNSLGNEFQVNSYTISDQKGPSVAMDAVGNFVVAWESGDLFNPQDGNAIGIFAQRYDKNGNPLGSEFQVNSQIINHQVWPSLALDMDGDFIVVWEDYYFQDKSGSGIFAQRYDKDGNPVGNEFQVNTYTTGPQQKPVVAMDQDGDFVIAWQSRHLPENTPGFFARRFNSGGAAKDINEFQVNAVSLNAFETLAVAMDVNSNFVITWTNESFENPPGQLGIYARTYAADGTSQNNEFLVNTYTTSIQTKPGVAMDTDGDFVIAWMSYGQDTDNTGIFAQRYKLSSSFEEKVYLPVVLKS